NTGPRVETYVVSAKLKDKSGFEVRQASGDLIIDAQEITITNLDLFPNESEFHGSFGFYFDSYADFKDVVHKVVMKTTLKDSKLYLPDLSYWSDSLETNEKYIGINGEMIGTVDNIRTKNLDLTFGKNSRYLGEARFTGLPDINETLLDFDMKNFNVSFEDIHTLIPNLNFPDYLYKSGELTFIGKYTGFVNDFVAYGTLYTPYGKVESDLNFKVSRSTNIPAYSGNLSLINFELGRLVEKEDLVGSINMSGHIDGRGITLADLEANIDANATYIDFNDYRYSTINLNGLLANKMFTGGVNIDDKNVKLDFDGTIDLSQSKPHYTFKAKVEHTDLHQLNFLTDKLLVDCMLDIDVIASNLDDIKGRVLVLNAHLETIDEFYDMSTLLLEADYNYGLKNIKLKSELASGELSGNFTYEKIPDLFQAIIAAYFDPSMFKDCDCISQDEFVSFDIILTKTAFINKLLKSKVVFDDNSRFKGDLRDFGNKLVLITSIPGLKVGDYYFSNLFINASSQQKSLIVYSSFQQLFIKDSLMAESVNLSATSMPDLLDFSLYLYNPKYENHLSLSGDMLLQKDNFKVILNNSYLLIEKNQRWDIVSDTISVTYKPEITIPYLELKQDDHFIKAYGTISKEGNHPLRVMIDNTDFSVVQHYIPVNLSDFDGILNGQLVIYDILGSPYFDAAFLVNPLYYRGDRLGLLSLSSNYINLTSNTNIQGSLMSEELEELMVIDGYVDFLEEKRVELNVEIPQSDVAYFEPFMNDLVTDLSGEINGSIRFSGPLKNYKVSGKAYLYDASFVVDYTKARYHLNDYVEVDEKGIYLNKISVKDDYNNSAVVFGEVSHDYFQDFNLSIGVLAQNLQGLHTTMEDNSLFYGDAFITGRMDVTGPLDDIQMDMKFKSEKNTYIRLNAFDDNNFTNYNFIRFTNVNNQSRYSYQEGNSTVSMNLDMEVTTDADVDIIFDLQTNDVISANGTGILKLQIDALGNVFLYGPFIIESGEYTFVAPLYLLKRKFKVKKGSTITWEGDPFVANSNIDAIYSLNASVYNLIKDSENLTDDEKSVYRSATFPVDAILHLTENLYSPQVSLDFEIYNDASISDAQRSIILDQQIRNIKSSEQELNKQVISLLVLNGFQPPETGIGQDPSFDNSLNANVSSLISTQLSKWLSGLSKELGSKYIDNVQLGVNYSTENKQYQREFDLIASGSLLNDRIELSGNYDVENINADFQVSYQPIKDRKFRLKVFSRSDKNTVYEQDISRQGFGIYLKQEFDNWPELFKRGKKETPL
ncbi:translocation/assembly module TamB domain-containing protein, partial [Bacteroidota bacterium]